MEVGDWTPSFSHANKRRDGLDAIRESRGLFTARATETTENREKAMTAPATKCTERAEEAGAGGSSE